MSAGGSARRAVPSVGPISTRLDGTQRQVEWAEDIRDGVVKAINSFAMARTVDAEEKIARADSGSGRAARAADRAREQLESLPATVRAVGDGLAKVDSAEWLINNLRNLGLDKVATADEMRENRGRVRDATIQNFNGILRALQGGGFVDESVGGGTRRSARSGAGRFW